MSVYLPRIFTVRPIRYDELPVLYAHTQWKLHRDAVSPTSHVIVALHDDVLVGYCAFQADRRSLNIDICAIESRLPGAGRALLDAVKARASQITAKDVLLVSEAWWKRRDFTLLAPATEDDEPGVVGAYEWWREDDLQLAALPYAPLWPHQSLARLTWDTEDQQRLDEAMQRMVKPNTLPMVSVPAAFVEAITQAIAAGQVAPETATALQAHLAEIEQIQREPLRRTLMWYGDALVRLVELHAPRELLDELQGMMREYVRQMQREQPTSGSDAVQGRPTTRTP